MQMIPRSFYLTVLIAVVPSTFAQNQIYWSTILGSEMSRANTDGSQVEVFLRGAFESPEHLALDTANGFMYWTDLGAGKIQRASLDGSNIEDLVEGLSDPRGIALDLEHALMYWGDVGTRTIQVANLTGTFPRTVISSVIPREIALDISANKIYWRSNDRIRRANLDGSNIEDLVSAIDGDGFAVDLQSGHLYWYDYESGIFRANLDGSNSEQLVAEVEFEQTASIALDVENGKVYWSNIYAVNSVYRSNLDGTDVEVLVADYAEPRVPVGLSIDKDSGKMYWVDPSLGYIQRADLNGSNLEIVIASVPANPDDLAIDRTGRRLYWSEPTGIYSSRLDGSQVQRVIPELIMPRGIVIDPLERKLYWAEWGRARFGRANLDGSFRELLDIDPGGNPGSMVLDANGGKLYWITDINDIIHRANLDGSQHEELIPGLDSPYGLSIDFVDQKIYWVELSTDTIHRANLDGSQVELVLEASTNLQGIRVVEIDSGNRKLYWASSRAIGVFDLRSMATETIVLDQTPGSDHPAGLALLVVNVDFEIESGTSLEIDVPTEGVFLDFAESGSMNGTVSVRRFDDNPPGSSAIETSEVTSSGGALEPDTITRHRYWSITGENLANFRYAVCLDVSRLDGLQNPEYLVVAKRDDPSDVWTPLNSTTEMRGDVAVVCVSDLDRFSQFTIASASAINPIRIEDADTLPEGRFIHIETVFPNPVAESAIVRIGSNRDVTATLNLHDSTGKLVKSLYEGVLPAGIVRRHTLNVTTLTNGIYFLHLTGGGSSTTRPLIVMPR